MGLRSFSMHPTQVASVKQKVLRSDTRRLAALLEAVLTSDDPEQKAGELFATVGGTGKKPVSEAAA